MVLWDLTETLVKFGECHTPSYKLIWSWRPFFISQDQCSLGNTLQNANSKMGYYFENNSNIYIICCN